ncbi:hypothetical protein Tco_0517959, partial [Tanacetum coccineum]
MHNNIMAAGSKERPPMLGPGRYSQWRSQSMKEQAYNKEQRKGPSPHELNDKNNLIDLMKE